MNTLGDTFQALHKSIEFRVLETECVYLGGSGDDKEHLDGSHEIIHAPEQWLVPAAFILTCLTYWSMC